MAVATMTKPFRDLLIKGIDKEMRVTHTNTTDLVKRNVKVGGVGYGVIMKVKKEKPISINSAFSLINKLNIPYNKSIYEESGLLTPSL